MSQELFVVFVHQSMGGRLREHWRKGEHSWQHGNMDGSQPCPNSVAEQCS